MIPPEADLAQALDEESGELAQVGASNLEALPLSEGNRKLWVWYIKLYRIIQETRAKCRPIRTGGELGRVAFTMPILAFTML